jgi:1-acyl-sn-glycerol-3-phosphate acyltransferase
MAQNPEASHLATAPAAILKLLWAVLATVLAVLYTAVLVTLAAVVSPFKHGRITNQIGRLWSLLIIRTCGIKVEVTGLENIAELKSFVLVTNHQSIFDIFAVMAFIPRQVRFVAKKELLRIPVFGIALKRSGHIVVDRQRGGPTVRQAIEVARRGFCICVFAEGHRYTDNQVHTFHDGAAWLAIQTRLPCVPMAISGTGAFFPRGAKLVVPGGRMRLALGPPIATADLKSSDRKELTRRLEEAVRARFVPQL